MWKERIEWLARYVRVELHHQRAVVVLRDRIREWINKPLLNLPRARGHSQCAQWVARSLPRRFV
jgi:hypothetical protein